MLMTLAGWPSVATIKWRLNPDALPSLGHGDAIVDRPAACCSFLLPGLDRVPDAPGNRLFKTYLSPENVAGMWLKCGISQGFFALRNRFAKCYNLLTIGVDKRRGAGL